MNIVNLLLASLIAYLIGSIPWALVIGKVFFKTDVREHGSGNLGGSNAGRVLGKEIGLLVIVLDALKAFLVVTFCVFVLKDITASVLAGLFACIGHCFPIFAKFKGGKGVATVLGYNIAISTFVSHQFLLMFLAPALLFLTLLAITKWVSLSSMLWLLSVTLISYFIEGFSIITISYFALWVFVVYRHRKNIERLITGKEKKITWIK